MKHIYATSKPYPHVCPLFEGPEPLVREVLPEVAAQELQSVRCMWEMAVVFEFLTVFRSYLRLNHLYPVADLEQALVESPGPGAKPAVAEAAALRGFSTPPSRLSGATAAGTVPAVAEAAALAGCITTTIWV